MDITTKRRNLAADFLQNAMKSDFPQPYVAAGRAAEQAAKAAAARSVKSLHIATSHSLLVFGRGNQFMATNARNSTVLRESEYRRTTTGYLKVNDGYAAFT
jgi:hypothetical protein